MAGPAATGNPTNGIRLEGETNMPTGITADELEELATGAAADMGKDSPTEGEQPEDPGGESETDELDDLETGDEDDDPDPDEEDSDNDVDDDEGAESDEDDDSDDEDEAGEEADDEDDEDGDEDDDSSDEESYTVKVRGEEEEVSLQELKDGYQRHADYTRDKQQLKEEQQQLQETWSKLETWYSQRANNPTGWINEIASQQEDPAGTIAGAIQESGNATVLLGQTLRNLVESGEIADELVEALNLTSVAEQAKEQSVHHEVEQLRNELRQQKQTEEQQVQQQQIARELNSQWQSIKQQEELQFDSEADEYDAKVELLQFAREQEIPNLETAWAAMSYKQRQAAEKGRKPAKKQASKKQKRRSAEDTVRKRKTSAMSTKPTGAPAGGKGSKVSESFDAAAEEALDELGLELDA